MVIEAALPIDAILTTQRRHQATVTKITRFATDSDLRQ